MDYLERISPNFLIAWHARRKVSETELLLISCLCPERSTAVDVGAHNGLYVRQLLQVAEKVIAFEPLPEKNAKLRRRFGRQIELHHQALSNLSGGAQLRVPGEDAGRSTIEPSNSLYQSDDPDSVRTVDIATAALDDFCLENVGFIKIDVEGHEANVLEGARNTISRDCPVLLIEIEERHRPGSVEEVTALLESSGYQGYFIDGAAVKSTNSFRPQVHQKIDRYGQPSSGYINNFIFLHHQGAELILRKVHARIEVR